MRAQGGFYSLKDLTVPARLRKGDTIALISISGGRAGDADMLSRYEKGKSRLREIFAVPREKRAIVTDNHTLAYLFAKRSK